MSFEGENLISGREGSRSSGYHLAWRSSVEFLFKDGKNCFLQEGIKQKNTGRNKMEETVFPLPKCYLVIYNLRMSKGKYL